MEAATVSVDAGRVMGADDKLLIGLDVLVDGPEVGRPIGDVGRRMKDLSGLEDAGQTGGGMAARAQLEQDRDATELLEKALGRRAAKLNISAQN